MEESRIPEVGDRVRVINETCGHEFNLGDKVKIVDIERGTELDGVFKCVNEKGAIQYLNIEEFELLEELPK